MFCGLRVLPISGLRLFLMVGIPGAGHCFPSSVFGIWPPHAWNIAHCLQASDQRPGEVRGAAGRDHEIGYRRSRRRDTCHRCTLSRTPSLYLPRSAVAGGTRHGKDTQPAALAYEDGKFLEGEDGRPVRILRRIPRSSAPLSRCQHSRHHRLLRPSASCRTTDRSDAIIARRGNSLGCSPCGPRAWHRTLIVT